MFPKKIWFWLIGSLMILGAFFFRISFLGQQSLWIDEGYSINAAQAVLDKGVPILPSGELYGKGILATYTITSSMAIFGFDPWNPWSARLPSVFFGLGLIVAVYFLSKKVFSSPVIAFAPSIIIAFSTWEIAWSRQARGYEGMQFFACLAILFFYTWLETKRYRDIGVAFAMLLISILFHPSAAVFLIPFGCALIFTYFGEMGGRKREILKFILISIVASVPIFYSVGLSTFTFRPDLGYLLFLKESLLSISFLALGTLVLVGFDIKKRRKLLYVAIFAILPLIAMSLFSYSVQMRYLLTIFPLLVILGSHCIVFLVSKGFHFKSEFSTTLLSVLLLAIITAPLLTVKIPDRYVLEWGSPQPNFSGAYKAIQSVRSPGDVVISPYTHMSKIYLGDSGYWLPISLTKNKNEVEEKTVNGGDYYTGAPKIDSQDSFGQFLDTEKGFVVFDHVARVRLGYKMMKVLGDDKPVLVYHDGAGETEIWVYQFK